MASKTSGGLSAAKPAAAQPAAAQTQGAALVGAAQATEVMNMQAVKVHGNAGEVSPIPPVPSGISNIPSAQPLNAPLRDDFNQVQQYLNILYPFTTPDPEDAYWQRRTSVVNADGNIPGVGKAIIPPEYFDYAQRKLNQQVADQFKTFVFQQIDLSTPASREYWETRFPEYTREFREGWSKRLGHMAKMGEMLINGVQTTEDLFYLFITEKGLNPVAYQYQGPPNASQVAAMFNMYQQTLGTGVGIGDQGVRSGPPAGNIQGFGANGIIGNPFLTQTRFSGSVRGPGRGPQVYGQQPGPQY